MTVSLDILTVVYFETIADQFVFDGHRLLPSDHHNLPCVDSACRGNSPSVILGGPNTGAFGNRFLITLHGSTAISGIGTVLAPVVFRPVGAITAEGGNIRVSHFNS